MVARRLGIPIRGIELHILGGAAKMARMPKTARDEILIAIAGPAVSQDPSPSAQPTIGAEATIVPEATATPFVRICAWSDSKIIFFQKNSLYCIFLCV